MNSAAWLATFITFAFRDFHLSCAAAQASGGNEEDQLRSIFRRPTDQAGEAWEVAVQLAAIYPIPPERQPRSRGLPAGLLDRLFYSRATTQPTN
jgi:hypothetical protein